MGRFDNWLERSAQGETLFYPWGMFGQGYVIEDSRRQRPLQLLRRSCGALLCVLLTIFSDLRTWIAAEITLSLGLIVLVGYHSGIKVLLAGAAPHTTRPTLERFAASYSLETLRALFQGCLALAAAGVFLAALGHTRDRVVAGVACGVMCGIGAVVSFRALRLKRS